MCDHCGCDGNETPCDGCSMIESAKRRTESTERVMLNALFRAHQWVNRDEVMHGREFGTGNEIRDAIEAATGERPESGI